MQSTRRLFLSAIAAAPALLADQSAAPPPSGATMLFDGRDLNSWQAMDGPPAEWKVRDGYCEVAPGSGHIVAREALLDHQIHVEFATPYMPEAKGQERGNSGVYIQGRYELQVLDSYGAPPEDDGCGAIYKLAAPLRNACRAPGEWQSYDIAFRAPRFDAAGTRTEKARVTILLNGILIHNNLELDKPTGGGWNGKVATPGPLLLQDHGNLVRYRNIWVLKG